MTFKYSFITKISHLVQSDFASLWIEKQSAALFPMNLNQTQTRPDVKKLYTSQPDCMQAFFSIPDGRMLLKLHNIHICRVLLPKVSVCPYFIWKEEKGKVIWRRPGIENFAKRPCSRHQGGENVRRKTLWNMFGHLNRLPLV